jgi:hypothetical protein
MDVHATTKRDEGADSNAAGATVGRRGAITRFAALGAAAFAGGAFSSTEKAGAATGTMVYGTVMSVGDTTTWFYSTSSNATMWFNNTGSGYALGVEKTSGSGPCLVVVSYADGAGVTSVRSNGGVAGAAVDASQLASGPVYRATSNATGNAEALFIGGHKGLGAGIDVALSNAANPSPAIAASTAGLSQAIRGTVNNVANRASGVRGDTNGTGFGVYGATAGSGVAVGGNGGLTGRGAAFASNVAQLRLIPGAGTSHPASGQPGDLYVDKSTRLWFCKGGAAWIQLG